MLNEAIQTDRVRLAIKDEKTGKSTSSIVTINEALEKARSMKLDLVLGESRFRVLPTSKPTYMGSYLRSLIPRLLMCSL